ncbi:MAG TPA: AEC family transporter [Candidatus Fimimorpha excrementavium]|nr:AEC family transporter [Candidatus Fimimorpha excrementavium]
MDNLIFSLNATVPVFLMMLLGMVFRKIGLMDREFAAKLNRFVFQIALPVVLFQDLAGEDFSQAWDFSFVAFCFLATLISILVIAAVSRLFVKREILGEFVQASYRSSAALLGIAFIQNIYGDAGMAPLMIIGTVPLYNIMAVLILSVMNPVSHKMDRAALKKAGIGILTNPILWGIAIGLLWSVCRIPQPEILKKTVDSVAALATPLGLMAMGAGFEGRKALTMVKPTMAASLIKLVVLAGIFLPVAIWLGFEKEQLVAVLIMLGSATTVSSYVMAKNMGHEGVLTSSVVMVTTCLSAFTLTGWLFLLRTFGVV